MRFPPNMYDTFRCDNSKPFALKCRPGGETKQRMPLARRQSPNPTAPYLNPNPYTMEAERGFQPRGPQVGRSLREVRTWYLCIFLDILICILIQPLIYPYVSLHTPSPKPPNLEAPNPSRSPYGWLSKLWSFFGVP